MNIETSMNQFRSLSPARVVQRILATLWIRRYLLLAPVVLGVPFGILLSYLMPQTYVARTLLLLQESGGVGVLSASTPIPPYQSQDRFNGLQALLKSERVLTAVVREVKRDDPPKTPREMSLAITDLTKAISLTLLSSEIIEVRLKGSKAEGLGKTLETITARLLESLLSPEDVVLTAPQMIVERRRDQLVAAEQAYATVAKLLDGQRLQGKGPVALADLENRQKATAMEIQGLRSQIGLKEGEKASLDASIDAARARLAELGSRTDAPRMDATIAQQHLQRLIELQALEKSYAQRKTEIAAVATSQPVKTEGGGGTATTQDLAQLNSAVLLAREKFNEAERRFGTRLGTNKFQILRAPEQITIIDAAKDPEFPELGRSAIVLLTILCGGLLGLGLALGSDFIDPRIRSAQTLMRITGAPVWGRLPASN